MISSASMYALAFVAFLSATASSLITTLGPKPIIIDTDIFSDVDDIGALAVANTLHNCGTVDLKAVIINTDSEYGSLAASAINTHFSNPEIPIAALRPLTNATFHDTWRFRLGEYASKVAHNFPRALQYASSTPEPVELYRATLAAASNASVTLISIGFLNNLADLLRSPPDAHSSLSGVELVGQKDAELVVMGGTYPSGWEFNFAYNISATRIVLREWPSTVPITFSGYELGSKILSGQGLPELASKESPVLAAYQWYGDRCNTTSASYDPVTVLYGALGLGDMFEFAKVVGYNEIAEDGRNQWVEDGVERGRRWLKFKAGVDETYVGEMLEHLYVGHALEQRCFDAAAGRTFKVQS